MCTKFTNILYGSVFVITFMIKYKIRISECEVQTSWFYSTSCLNSHKEVVIV